MCVIVHTKYKETLKVKQRLKSRSYSLYIYACKLLSKQLYILPCFSCFYQLFITRSNIDHFNAVISLTEMLVFHTNYKKQMKNHSIK